MQSNRKPPLPPNHPLLHLRRPATPPVRNRIVQPKIRPATPPHRGNVVQPALVAAGVAAAAVAVAASPVAAGVRRSARIASAGYSHQYLPMIAGFLISPTTIDKNGVHYWNGYRSGLSFSAATKLAMAGTKGNGCQVKASCTSAAVSLDHIQDFATTQSALPTHTYCDGSHHWTGVLLADAQADYNNVGNLQWSCTSCNSSKSGARGLYSPPRHAGQCPGAAACTY